MTFLQNPPPFEALGAQFDWSQTRVAERSHRRHSHGRPYYFCSDAFKRIKYTVRRGVRKELKFIQRYAARHGGRFLDVGCADGGTLRQIRHPPWTLYGIEPSAELAGRADAYCRKTGGYVITNVAARALPEFPDVFFQCIMMRSYLEHETECHLVLREAHRILAPGGIVILKMPNYACWNSRLRKGGWPGVRLPDHVNYFRPRDLMAVVRQAGFTQIHFPFWFHLPTSDNMWMVLTR